MGNLETSASTNENRLLIGLGLTSRIVIDTASQMFIAFLPIIAAGIGVTPLVMGRLISLRSAAGLLAPLSGLLTERIGYRLMLRNTLYLAGVGLLAFTFSGGVASAALAIFVVGAGIFSFGPLLQAFASERFSEKNRARGMGIIEYGFAIASIVGLFAVGQLIEVFDWRVPVYLLAAACIVSGSSYMLLSKSPQQIRQVSGLRDIFSIEKENRRAVATAITLLFLIVFSALHTFTAYSTWLFEEHQFGARQLGTLALVFGVVDLAGSGLVSMRLNQIGRKRALIIAGVIGTFAHTLLPFSNALSLGLALAVLLFARFAFEFGIVSIIIITSETAPSQRARVMTLAAAIGTFGLALAGLTGIQAYATFGLLGMSLPSAIASAAIALVAWRLMD